MHCCDGNSHNAAKQPPGKQRTRTDRAAGAVGVLAGQQLSLKPMLCCVGRSTPSCGM
jgi:hypothetical protein